MILRVLGCAGAELPGCNPPAFLIDDSLLLDAGTIGAALGEEEQWAIREIFVTHCHLDHVRGIPFFADNLVLKNRLDRLTVFSSAEVLASLQGHIMNNLVWPDFSRIPSPETPVLRYREIESGETLGVGGYSVSACSVTHSVPAQGYLVRKGEKALLYTGDTGPTEAIWREAVRLSAIIVEVSFPNDMERLALLTGHLTPKLLMKELEKVRDLPPRILITHLKPQFYPEIERELAELGIPRLELLREGGRYHL